MYFSIINANTFSKDTLNTDMLNTGTLNTDTFRALLRDETEKDLFIFFAGPACFNCADVWPHFEKLVRALHKDSISIIFAYVDLAQNEL